MADKKRINLESVSNPIQLEKLLNAMQDAAEETRALGNELKSDQDTAMGAYMHSPGSLQASSSAAKMKIGNNIAYTIGGTTYRKAAAGSITFTASSHDLSASSYAWYLVTIDASGSMDVTMGSAVDSASSAALPALPSSQAAIGGLFGKGGTSGFDATSENISAASGLTSAEFYDFIGVYPLSVPAAISASSVSDYIDQGV